MNIGAHCASPTTPIFRSMGAVVASAGLADGPDEDSAAGALAAGAAGTLAAGAIVAGAAAGLAAGDAGPAAGAHAASHTAATTLIPTERDRLRAMVPSRLAPRGLRGSSPTDRAAG